MNEQRFVVTDILWRRLEPHLPGKVSDAGVTAKDNRMFLEAVFWRVRTGSPWRDLPPAFGQWNSQFRRFRRWARAGVFESLFKAIRRDFLRIYTEKVSKQAARLKIVEDAPKQSGVFQFRFAGLEPHGRRLTKGAAYPILGAFRNYVRINPESEKAEWVGGFDNVKAVWNEIGRDLVLETREAINSIGNAPDVLGKNRNHWANLYRTVENHFLRSEIERLTVGGA